MKRRLIQLVTLILIIMLFTACGRGGKNSATGVVNSNNENGMSNEEKQIFAELFDINNKIKIDIDISDEQLLLLQQDYEKYSEMDSKSPIYREAALTILVTTEEETKKYEFEKVGIRIKGNTSRSDFYSDSGGKYNLVHYKIEFPEEFAGLEHLDVRWNKLDDSTYIREYYSYEFFRANGILAPHTNLASVDVAGIHEGVFTILEPIDKNFIERNLPQEDWDGDLYKAGWDGDGAQLTPDMTVGIEDEDIPEFYHYDLKNNKKTSNHELMKNLIEELNDGDVTREEIEELIDIDYFMNFAAISYFVGNPDDIRYNFNNHYIYFLKSSNKAIFIPYDNDRCFGVTKEWNPTGDGMASVNPFSTLADGAGIDQTNPLFIYTVDAGGYYIEEYAKALQNIAESEWLTTEKFDAIYEIAYGNYKKDAKPGKSFGNAAWNNLSFDNSASAGLNSIFGNASFKEYLEAKMKYFEEYISEVENYK